jgi:hypothetical protein
MSYSSTHSGVTIDYSAYIFAHGHAPRGTGGWAFHMGSRSDLSNIYWAPRGTFAEAKKAAVQEAKRLNQGHFTCSLQAATILLRSHPNPFILSMTIVPP